MKKNKFPPLPLIILVGIVLIAFVFISSNENNELRDRIQTLEKEKCLPFDVRWHCRKN